MTTNGSSNAPGRARPLDVRVRCTLHGDGGVSRQATVYCPQRERSVHVDECSQCERWAGLRVDSARHQSFVMCELDDSGAATTSHAPADFALVTHTATPVGEIIAKNTVCVSGDMSIEAVTTLLLDRGLSGVAVIDEHGKPIGVLSKTDLLRREQIDGENTESESPRMRAGERDDVPLGVGFHTCELASLSARDLMTPVVLWVDERASIGQAAALMAYEGVHQLPVLSQDRDVVGLLTSVDLLRWMGRHSGYIIPERGGR
jgi:CBS domain-containing protein